MAKWKTGKVIYSALVVYSKFFFSFLILFYRSVLFLQFQSHQLFHMFVVTAAFVHFYGITLMAVKRLEQGSCAEQLYERYGIESYSSYLGDLFGLDEI